MNLAKLLPHEPLITGVAMACPQRLASCEPGPGTRKQSPCRSWLLGGLTAVFEMLASKPSRCNRGRGVGLIGKGRMDACAMLRVGLAMLQGARHEHAEAASRSRFEGTRASTMEIVECRRRALATLMPPWTPSCSPVANPPPCASPVRTNAPLLAALFGRMDAPPRTACARHAVRRGHPPR